MSTETTEYAFRIKKTQSNVRRRDCEHCKKRTGQLQGEDPSGKFVEKFKCRSCLEETK